MSSAEFPIFCQVYYHRNLKFQNQIQHGEIAYKWERVYQIFSFRKS